MACKHPWTVQGCDAIEHVPRIRAALESIRQSPLPPAVAAVSQLEEGLKNRNLQHLVFEPRVQNDVIASMFAKVQIVVLYHWSSI